MYFLSYAIGMHEYTLDKCSQNEYISIFSQVMH